MAPVTDFSMIRLLMPERVVYHIKITDSNRHEIAINTQITAASNKNRRVPEIPLQQSLDSVNSYDDLIKSSRLLPLVEKYLPQF